MMAAFRIVVMFFICCLGYASPQSLTFSEALDRKYVNVKSYIHTRSEVIPAKANDVRDCLDVFCHDGERKPLSERIKYMFRMAKLHINISNADYRVFIGANESHVWDQYHKASKSWIFFPWQTSSVSMAPFNRTCVGVATREKYAVTFIISNNDTWLLMSLVIGLVLFFIADTLSRNILFYYGTGISVGMLASLIILLFVMSRFLPWKKGAYAFILGGWAVMSWAAMQVWGNIQDILKDHYQYVLGYFITTALISFAYLYYRGPVSDPRATNLIKWSIQSIGCFLIFNSSQVPEASFAMLLGVFTVHNFPTSIIVTFLKFFRLRFPRKRRLLTQEEFEEQASVHTRKALEELREYCRSPDCDAWKTISRLNTPQRFAKWVEGSPHMSDDELDVYDSDPHTSYPSITDDEDDIDFRLNSL